VFPAKRSARGEVRDIRAFKIEHWSDFTALVKR
jgi:virulence-associated protein VapD